MSHSIALPSLEFLLVAGRAVTLLLALMLFAWGFMRWRRALQLDTQRVFEQLDLVRADLLIMKEVMRGSAQRTETTPRASYESRLSPTPATSAGRSYEIAARLARNGAQKDELIKNCGITAHEADLLVKLHGRAREVLPDFNESENVADVARSSHRPASTSQPKASRARSRLMAVG